jgi:hypothetical protein
MVVEAVRAWSFSTILFSQLLGHGAFSKTLSLVEVLATASWVCPAEHNLDSYRASE